MGWGSFTVSGGRFVRIAVILVVGLTVIGAGADAGKHTFTRLAEGIEMAEFPVPGRRISADTMLVVVRIDPTKYSFKLVGITNTKEREGLTTREWCEEYGLVGAVNAGMFHEDYRTHVGYMRAGDHVNSSKVNDYMSVAAFDPVRSGSPAFRIFDLENVSVGVIKEGYRSLVQNLRLIKRPGENRWSKQEKMWSEVALGEDEAGRMLWIFCRAPLTMYELNRLLLSLPIDLVCAQHLEGGPEAQLYLVAGETQLEMVGSFESGFHPSDENFRAWPVPIVIGIVKK